MLKRMNQVVVSLVAIALSACGNSATPVAATVSSDNVGSGISAVFSGGGSQARSVPKKVIDLFIQRALAVTEETCGSIEEDSDMDITMGENLAALTTEASIQLGKDSLEFTEADFCKANDGTDQAGPHSDGGDLYNTYVIGEVEMDCTASDGEEFKLKMTDGRGAWRNTYDEQTDLRDGTDIKGSFVVDAVEYHCNLEIADGSEGGEELFTANCKDENGADVVVDAQASCS